MPRIQYSAGKVFICLPVLYIVFSGVGPSLSSSNDINGIDRLKCIHITNLVLGVFVRVAFNLEYSP